MPEEKRRHKRIQVNVPITINRSVKARVVDLSESGVFVEASMQIEEGAALVIQFDEGDGKMLFGAIVRQSTRKKGKFYGFGAELGSLTPDHKEFVRALIETITKSKPEKAIRSILLIDADATSRFIYGNAIRGGGYDVITRENVSDIAVVFAHHQPAAVVLEYNEYTLAAVETIRGIGTKVPIIILSRLPHIPAEKFEGLDVMHCPKYRMTPARFMKEVIQKLVPK